MQRAWNEKPTLHSALGDPPTHTLPYKLPSRGDPEKVQHKRPKGYSLKALERVGASTCQLSRGKAQLTHHSVRESGTLESPLPWGRKSAGNP